MPALSDWGVADVVTQRSECSECGMLTEGMVAHRDTGLRVPIPYRPHTGDVEVVGTWYWTGGVTQWLGRPAAFAVVGVGSRPLTETSTSGLNTSVRYCRKNGVQIRCSALAEDGSCRRRQRSVAACTALRVVAAPCCKHRDAIECYQRPCTLPVPL